MTKREEQRDPSSCLNKAHDGELIFVILERDPAAAATIRHWCDVRVRMGLDNPGSPKLAEAMDIAAAMEVGPYRKATAEDNAVKVFDVPAAIRCEGGHVDNITMRQHAADADEAKRVTVQWGGLLDGSSPLFIKPDTTEGVRAVQSMYACRICGKPFRVEVGEPVHVDERLDAGVTQILFNGKPVGGCRLHLPGA